MWAARTQVFRREPSGPSGFFRFASSTYPSVTRHRPEELCRSLTLSLTLSNSLYVSRSNVTAIRTPGKLYYAVVSFIVSPFLSLRSYPFRVVQFCCRLPRKFARYIKATDRRGGRGGLFLFIHPGFSGRFKGPGQSMVDYY